MKKHQNLDNYIIPDDEKEKAWEWRLHEDVLFSERNNYYTLIESILVASYVYLWSISSNDDFIMYIIMIVAIAGILLTSTWFLVIHLQLNTTTRPLSKLIKHKYSFYRKICDDRGKAAEYVENILGKLIPMMFLIIWILFLLFVLDVIDWV